MIEPSNASNRIAALDFTKGILVLFMVFYHWLNYFVATTGEIYKYLRFLTPSFIFISGFLISHVHLSRYGSDNNRLPKRLFIRGLKLLGLFVALNALICVIFPDSPTAKALSGDLLANLNAIFVSGNVAINGIGKTAAFIILVPIGYLLMVSALFLYVSRFIKYVFYAGAGLAVLSVFLLTASGAQSANLELLAFGLLGIISGYIPQRTISKLSQHPYWVVSMYAIYLGLITVWYVPFPVRIVGVYSTLILFYVMGANNGKTGWLRRHILLLGNYSLFAYVAQIAILQLLRRSLSHGEPEIVVLSGSFIAGFAITMISVEFVDWARKRSSSLNYLYRVVFA